MTDLEKKAHNDRIRNSDRRVFRIVLLYVLIALPYFFTTHTGEAETNFKQFSKFYVTCGAYQGIIIRETKALVVIQDFPQSPQTFKKADCQEVP